MQTACLAIRRGREKGEKEKIWPSHATSSTHSDMFPYYARILSFKAVFIKQNNGNYQ
jgi:hypothetical protein